MKRIIIVIILAFIISACDKSSDKDTDTSMRIKPGTLSKFESPVPGTGTLYNTNLGNGSYAIIYNGTINGISYVGIALSNNPDPEGTETFNIKIYFEASSIPSAGSSVNLTAGGDNLKIIYYNGTITSDITADLTLNFISSSVGTQYTTYTITGSGSGSLNNISNIIAVKVGS